MPSFLDRLKTLGTEAAKTAAGFVAPTATGIVSLAMRLKELSEQPKEPEQPVQQFRVGAGLTTPQVQKARDVISRQAELQKQEEESKSLGQKLQSLTLTRAITGEPSEVALKAKALTSFGTQDPELLAIQKEEMMNVGLMSAGMKDVGKLGKALFKKVSEKSQQPLLQEPLSKLKTLPPKEVPTYIPSETQLGKNVKERRFLQSVKEDPRVSQETKNILEQLPDERKYYDVFTDREAVSRAQTRVSENKESALSFVLSSKEADKEVAATGIELMRNYRLARNTAMEAEVAASLAEKATKGGQFVQAFSILDKLSPEGVLVYASKRTGEKLSPQLTEKLVTQVSKIQELPYGFAKMQEIGNLAKTIEREMPESLSFKTTNWLKEFANIPRAIQSSFDFSFGLRQGLVSLARYPKQFAGAFKSQFLPFFSEKRYADVMDSVVKHPDFPLASRATVAFSDINAQMSLREERFASSLAEKIPAIGPIVRASNRAYTAFANKLRMDVFSSMIRNAEKSNPNVLKDEGTLREFGQLVNDMTGRGDLPQALKSSADILNGFFYSPRLMFSRLHLLNPVGYMSKAPEVRKEYIKTMLSFGTMVGSILGLASLNKNVTIETRTNSADWGKIKIGDTRVDIMGGFQQYVRIASQVISGKYISSSTGKIITLGEGYKPLTKKEILLRGIESKEAPIFSFISALLQGQDFEGNKLNIPLEIGSRFVPMLISDVYDISQSNPDLLPLGFLGALGVGTQTYAPPEAWRKLNELESSNDPIGGFEALKKENPRLAEKVKRAKTESSFNEFDWGLTYMGVENGNRAQFLIEYFKKLPSNEERATLWEDLRKKKLISERVSEQINYLMENPEYQPAK